jgi:hypothetical protein
MLSDAFALYPRELIASLTASSWHVNANIIVNIRMSGMIVKYVKIHSVKSSNEKNTLKLSLYISAGTIKNKL